MNAIDRKALNLKVKKTSSFRRKPESSKHLSSLDPGLRLDDMRHFNKVILDGN